MKRALNFGILVAILIMAMPSCKEDKGTAVTGVTLNRTDPVTIPVDGTLELTALVEPADAAQKNIVWSSSKPAVATVVGGKVVGLLPGTAEIVATTVDGGKSVSMTVTVIVPVKGVMLNEKTASIMVGENKILTYTMVPTIATNKGVTWSSANPAVASVDAITGKITGLSEGTANIIATTVEGGMTDNCAVTVVAAIHVTGITLNKNTLALLLPDKTETLVYTITPSNASDKNVVWSSSDESVATVDAATGTVTPVSFGKSTITVTTVDGGFSATCTVSVSNNLLQNPGFESPDNAQNTLTNGTDGWTYVPATWFTSYYGANAGTNPGAAGPVRAQSDFYTGSGAGVDIASIFTGKYTARVANGSSGGAYQLVTVIPGATYLFRFDIAFRVNNTANQTIKNNEAVKILSPDGVIAYSSLPIPNTPVFTGTAANTSYVINKGLTGTVTIPAGVTQIRFQIDQRTYAQPTAAPNMCWDECVFQQLP